MVYWRPCTFKSVGQQSQVSPHGHSMKSNKTYPVSISISDRSSCMALYGVEKLILHNVNLVGG